MSLQQQTELRKVIKDGDLQQLQQGVDNGSLILRAGCGNNQPATVAAAHFNQVEVLNFLVAMGCSVDATTPAGITPVIAAALGGHLKVLRYLSAAGANFNVTVTRGGPLFCSLTAGHWNVATWLVSSGVCDPKQETNKAGETVLNYAIRKDSRTVAKMIELQWFDANEATAAGYTPPLTSISVNFWGTGLAVLIVAGIVCYSRAQKDQRH